MHCRCQHIPNPWLDRMLFIVIIDSHGNATFLGRQHIHSQRKTSLKTDDVTARNGPAINTRALELISELLGWVNCVYLMK